MAKFEFESSTRRGFSGSEYDLFLDGLSEYADEIAKQAIYEGAKIIADEMNRAIDTIPEEKFRFLAMDGVDKLNSITPSEKQALKESFGITPISGNEFSGWNAKIGFDGYGPIATKKYPKGVPNQLIGRAVESGSSVRTKYPFVRRTVNKTRKQVEEAMEEAVNDCIKKLEKTGGI